MMSLRQSFTDIEWEILQTRANHAARLVQQNQQDELESALVVRIGNEQYALPLTALVAVHEGLTIVPVPCTPAYIAGVVNIRGSIMTVFEAAALLEIPDFVHDDTALVIATAGQLSAAFRVTEIEKLVNYASNELTPLPSTGASSTYIQGILPNGAALLNIHAILTDPSLMITATIE